MSDLLFNDVVIEDGSTVIDVSDDDEFPDHKRAYRACCSSCGTYHISHTYEFKYPIVATDDVLEYVATMRAWNCCHEGEEPMDGLPEEPDRLLLGRAE